MRNLKIFLASLVPINGLIAKSDKIKISFTSYPNLCSDHFIIEGKNLNNIDHAFTVMITNDTKKIIFTLEKKSFFQNDPIIGSTIIDISDISRELDDLTNVEMKTLDIYKPAASLYDAKNLFEKKNKIVGKLIFQFSIQDAYLSSKLKQHPSKKSYNGKNYTKINFYESSNSEYSFVSDTETVFN